MDLSDSIWHMNLNPLRCTLTSGVSSDFNVSLRLAGTQFRVYLAYCPNTAGIGSRMPRDPREEKQIQKWMDGDLSLSLAQN